MIKIVPSYTLQVHTVITDILTAVSPTAAARMRMLKMKNLSLLHGMMAVGVTKRLMTGGAPMETSLMIPSGEEPLGTTVMSTSIEIRMALLGRGTMGKQSFITIKTLGQAPKRRMMHLDTDNKLLLLMGLPLYLGNMQHEQLLQQLIQLRISQNWMRWM